MAEGQPTQQDLFGQEQPVPPGMDLRAKIPGRPCAPSKLTPEQKQEMVARYVTGEPVKAIAAECGTSEASVHYVRRLHGKLARRPNMTEQHKAEVVRLAQEGTPVPVITARVGFSDTTVRAVIRQAGIDVPKSKNPPLTEKQKDELVAAYQGGEPSTSIGVRYNISPASVLQYVKRRGAATRGRSYDLPDHLKYCPKCDQVKVKADDFYAKTKNGKTVPDSWCKVCFRADRYAYNKEKAKELRVHIRQEMIEAYGGKCGCCGDTAPEFLTIDHVSGDGCRHRKQLKKWGTQMYLWLKEQGWPKDNYRLLCYNCNCARGRYGYCPHERGHKHPAIPD